MTCSFHNSWSICVSAAIVMCGGGDMLHVEGVRAVVDRCHTISPISCTTSKLFALLVCQANICAGLCGAAYHC